MIIKKVKKKNKIINKSKNVKINKHISIKKLKIKFKREKYPSKLNKTHLNDTSTIIMI